MNIIKNNNKAIGKDQKYNGCGAKVNHFRVFCGRITILRKFLEKNFYENRNKSSGRSLVGQCSDRGVSCHVAGGGDRYCARFPLADVKVVRSRRACVICRLVTTDTTPRRPFLDQVNHVVTCTFGSGDRFIQSSGVVIGRQVRSWNAPWSAFLP